MGASSVVGIELVAEAAERAREHYEAVHVGPAEQLVEELDGPFDTIVAYDVLEHLVDPWAVLRRLRDLAAPGGHLHVSVPNVRHLSLAYDVYLRGTFGYTAWGHRDQTHLRWFTPRDIEAAVREAGFAVLRSEPPPLSRPREALSRVTGGRAAELLVWQWQVLARA
jgi:2-polyprenyl-3-methyl-5-hydroxy-6-metoxy-1,4-benzoquinol methylase